MSYYSVLATKILILKPNLSIEDKSKGTFNSEFNEDDGRPLK